MVEEVVQVSFNSLIVLLDSHLGYIGADTMLLLSYLFGNVIQLPLWIIAGVQDWRKHEVKGWVCVASMVLTLLHAIVFSTIISVLVVVVCAYFAFREKEIPLIGQADFVLFAHWATIYMTVYGSGYGMFIVASVIFLVCLLGYILVYRGKDGKRWKPGTMVPLIPPYSVSLVITTLVQYPASCALFLMGA